MMDTRQESYATPAFALMQPDRDSPAPNADLLLGMTQQFSRTLTFALSIPIWAASLTKGQLDL